MHPWIEFLEFHHADGTMIRTACDQLPMAYDGKRFSYTIKQRADGVCECKSRKNGPGSTRYYTFETIEQAFDHGIKWTRAAVAKATGE